MALPNPNDPDKKDKSESDKKQKEKQQFGIAKQRHTGSSFLDFDREVAEESTRKRQKTLDEFRRREEEEITAARAKKRNMQYQNLQIFPIDHQTLVLLTPQEARQYQAVCISQNSLELFIATPNPENPALDVLDKRFAKKLGVRVQTVLVSKSSFEHALDEYDKLKTTERPTLDTTNGEGQDAATSAKQNVQSLEDLAQRLKSVPTSDIIDVIMGAAITLGSSDVHIEPEENVIKIRYRIDGVLQDAASPDKSVYQQVISRIKLLAKLKLNVTTIPQDGRFEFTPAGGEKVDIRVSTLPSAYGEAVVMRLLGSKATQLFLEDLGLRPHDMKIVEEELQKPNGMILTTGPTGSGKTTTLYAFLNKMNAPGIKIITLEDPVEYKLKGISQTQIDRSRGYDFAAGLRAVLRQDPDVVMVGEIRDLETAEIALQAALTGHVVFSTIHTNDSSGVIPRLINMGVRPFTIPPAINAVIAQRLVRRICSDCVNKVPADAATIAVLKEELGKLFTEDMEKSLVIPQAKGCDACNHTGYKGRVGVYEIFRVDKKMENLVLSAASTGEIRDYTIEQGMITMRQDGFLKVIDGMTTLEEVDRVT
jgi:type II secretory ATPase GspE/PulE/Tfp pilus assembly ATPase PilB-like protein